MHVLSFLLPDLYKFYKIDTMKKKIETREELLKQLACNGDAHAFFSLGSPYFQTRYLQERSKGESHTDAQTGILADAIELLEGVQYVTPTNFDRWFDEHCTMIASSAEEEFGDVVLDQKIAAETASFLSICNRELLKTGSDIKRRNVRDKHQFPGIIFKNKIFVWVISILGVIVFTGAGTLLLINFNTTVSFTVSHDNDHFFVQFPPASLMKAEKEELLETFSRLAGDTLSDDTVSLQADSSKDSVTIVKDKISKSDVPAGSSSKTITRKTLPPVVPKARMKANVSAPVVPVSPPPSPPPPSPLTVEPVNPEEPPVNDENTFVQPAAPDPLPLPEAEPTDQTN